MKSQKGEVVDREKMTLDFTTGQKDEHSFYRLAQLVEQSTNAIILTDIGGNIVYANHAFESMTGYKFSEVFGKNPRFLKSGFHDNDFYKGLWQTITSGKTWSGTFVNRKKNGEIYYEEALIFPIKDFEGNIINYAAIKTDITKRVEAEEALSKALKYSRSVIDALGEGLLGVDKEGRVLFLNPAAEKMLGWSEDEIIGKDFHRIIDRPGYRDKNFDSRKCPLMSALKEGRSFRSEEVFVNKSGKAFPVSCISNAFIEEGEVTGAILAFSDITEQKASEKSLHDLLELNQNVIASIPSAILVFDSDLNLTMANPVFMENCCLKAGKFSGTTIRDILPASFLGTNRIFEKIKACAEHGGYDEILDMEWIHPEMGRRFFDVRIKGVLSRHGDQDKSGARVIIVIDDVTAQRSLEDKLSQAAKLESIGKLAGGIAHDFNNLLTGIMGYTELALMQAESPSIKSDLEQVMKLSERARNLIRQLLAFSRKQALSPQSLNLNELVSDMSKMLKRIIGEDVDLEFLPDPRLWNTFADPVQVEQIVMNLVINARDAMPDGGKLTIETKNMDLGPEYIMRHPQVKEGPYVMLAVTDTGKGIEKGIIEHIFEPFFTTKELGKGSGLGLSTVYGIVKQHKGFIWVYSEPGIGTTFKVYLPRIEKEVKQDTISYDKKRLNGKGNETILLVEDEGPVRRVAERILTEHGYKVFSADSPDKAIHLFNTHKDSIDLLFTDIVMPGMNGKELYMRLSREKPDLKVLYMSGYTENVIVRHGVLDSEVNFIQKPFTPETLGQKVRWTLDLK